MVSSTRGRLLILLLTFGLWLSPPAMAKEKNGLAIGGEAGFTNSGLSVKYAIGNFHIQLLTGLDFFSPDDLDRIDVEFAATLRFLYAVARMRDETNFVIGAGATFALSNPAPSNDIDFSVTLELVVGVEHFFNDFFAVVGFVGIPVELSAVRDVTFVDPADGVTKTEPREGVGWSIRGVAWGAGFHFYF